MQIESFKVAITFICYTCGDLLMTWHSQRLLRLIFAGIHRPGFLLDCQWKVISAYLIHTNYACFK